MVAAVVGFVFAARGKTRQWLNDTGVYKGCHEARWRPEHASKDTDIPAGFKITPQDAVAREKGL